MGIFGSNKAPETDSSDSGPDSSAADLEAIKEKLRPTRSSKSERIRQQAREAEEELELSKLFSEDQWEPIATFYHDVRFATTGFEGFELSPEKRKKLAASLSLAAKYTVKLNPMYLALFIFGMNYASSIGAAEVAYSNYKKAKNNGHHTRQPLDMP